MVSSSSSLPPGFSDGTTQDLTNIVTWSSSNNSIATVSSTGLASTMAVGGPITITAVYNGVSCATTTTCGSLTVNTATLVSIAIAPLNPVIAKGFTQQFTATATYTDSSTYDVSAYPTTTWSSSTSAATINSTGLATAANVGASTIGASFGGKSNSTTMTVTSAVLVSISITPANPSIPAGVTQQFTATGNFSDSSTQNLTTSASWTSNNTAAASINAGGLASAIAVGSSTIRATVGSVTSTTTLTVNNATLTSIAVTPAGTTLARGSSQQYTATGTYSNSTSFNITSSVTWASSNARKVTITSGGVATRLKNGADNINATKAAITGTTQVF